MMTNRPWANRSRWITGIAVCASAVGLAALLGAAMTPSPAVPAAAAALAPTEQENYVARRVADIVAREHYRRAPLDDHLSSLILDRYLDAIDGGRSYFFASDIAEFERYRYELDDAIKAGDVEPAFVIFRRYQQRSRERMAYAIELLNKKPDFDVDESFNFDREKEPWPANTAEMNELWRKRVKNDALSLVIAGKQWTEAADVLRKRYEHVAKRMDQSKPEDVFEAFMNAFVLSLDPHSNYFSARNSEEYNIQMSLSYEGIGASLQLTDDYVTVIDVIAGRSGRDQRQARRQRPHYRGRRRQDRRTDRRDRLAPGRRRAEDPRARRHVGAPAVAARRRRARLGAEGRGIHAQPRIARSSGGAQGDAGRAAQRPRRESRHHHRAELLPGLRRQPRRGEGLPQHHARRAAPDRRTEERRRRCADHGSARQRRRLSAGSRVAHGSVHRPRTGGAAARYHRTHRGRRRSRSGGFLQRPDDRAGGSIQRLGLGNLCRRHPGLRPRPHRRPADLRQGYGAKRAPAQLHDFRTQAGVGPAQRDHRQVLSDHRREHSRPRRDPRHRIAVADRRQRSRREHARPRPALGSHRTRRVQSRRRSEVHRPLHWRSCTRSAPRTAPTSAICTTTSRLSTRCAARRRSR